jgi:hypothetical protein
VLLLTHQLIKIAKTFSPDDAAQRRLVTVQHRLQDDSLIILFAFA